jgi:hypothetical protein
MKKTLLLFLFCAAITTAFAQTADEVINKFVEASGGKAKLNAVNTLQYNQLIKIKSPMGEFELPMQFYKEKNKLFRVQASMQMGSEPLSFFSVVSDTAAHVMLPAFMGSEGGLKKLTDKERQLQAYQLDPAGYFAGLVDYAAKGNKVELIKDEKAKNDDSYKLKLTMKTGQEMTYFISKATNLVTRFDVKGAMAASMSGMGAMMGGAGRVDKMEVSTIYTDYKDFDGVKFPTKVIIKSQMGDSESTISNVKINQPIDPRLYRAE